MKSVPSFSLRIWRSLCKALSSSTLPKGSPGRSEPRPCTSSQPRSLPPKPRATVPAEPGGHGGPRVPTQRAATARAVSILLPVCREDHHTLFACCQLKNKRLPGSRERQHWRLEGVKARGSAWCTSSRTLGTADRLAEPSDQLIFLWRCQPLSGDSKRAAREASPRPARRSPALLASPLGGGHVLVPPPRSTTVARPHAVPPTSGV